METSFNYGREAASRARILRHRTLATDARVERNLNPPPNHLWTIALSLFLVLSIMVAIKSSTNLTAAKAHLAAVELGASRRNTMIFNLTLEAFRGARGKH